MIVLLSGLFSDPFFCDITKAFDRVWQKGLVLKLRSVGISVSLLAWFKII